LLHVLAQLHLQKIVHHGEHSEAQRQKPDDHLYWPSLPCGSGQGRLSLLPSFGKRVSSSGAVIAVVTSLLFISPQSKAFDSRRVSIAAMGELA
jgi:hypothetical protein